MFSAHECRFGFHDVMPFEMISCSCVLLEMALYAICENMYSNRASCGLLHVSWKVLMYMCITFEVRVMCDVLCANAIGCKAVVLLFVDKPDVFCTVVCSLNRPTESGLGCKDATLSTILLQVVVMVVDCTGR